MTFKAGDKVKVLRKAKNYENGWGNGWVSKMARLAALELGRTVKFVNADMVQAELEKLGLKSSDLGNAAGGIFRGKMWKDTGRSILSNRGKSHRRKITVWEYVGESLTGGVRTSASVVPVGTKTEYTLTELTPATAKIGLKVIIGPKYNLNDSCKKLVGSKGEIVALPVGGKQLITVSVEHIGDHLYNRELLFYPHELVLSETPAPSQLAPGTKATRENLKVGMRVKSIILHTGIQHIGEVASISSDLREQWPINVVFPNNYLSGIPHSYDELELA